MEYLPTKHPTNLQITQQTQIDEQDKWFYEETDLFWKKFHPLAM